jgi:hypothetical protein
MEGSMGVENIFKFIGISVVRPFNYLNQPDVTKFGITTSVTLLF